jgi:Tol biopolymer transport system component
MTGQTLGHYRILEPLGKGGMGEVYLAEDTKLGRQVALKILSKDLAGDVDRRQRFEREARAAAALNHPNIVTIHSVEEEDGVPFLTLELVEGRTLSELIPPGGMPLERLLAVAIPLADAIGAAHQRGITHRDLKPANVMVTGDGRVKVLDFGLAKLKEDAWAAAAASMPTAELTGEGRILGTVAYMSPEQAEGRAVDPRTDVFALGVLLYEMATGERPFKGDNQMSVLSAIIKDTPSSVTSVKRDLPRDLGRIVQRCLAKDPEDRYQTAKDLRNDLRMLKEDLASGELAAVAASGARPAPPLAARTVWQRPAVIGVVGALAALAIAVYVFGFGAAPAAPERAPFQSVSLTRLTTTGTAGLAALSGDGRYAAYVVSGNREQSLWLRQVTTSSNVQVVPPGDARYDGVSFSPDSSYIYYVVYARGENLASLFQVPVLGGGARKLLEDIDTAPSFSPDGRRFAFLRGFPDQGSTAVMLADADGGNEQQLALRKRPLDFALDAVAWSPDGRVIAAPGLDTETLAASIVIVDAETGEERTLGSHAWQSVRHMAWLPDGRTLLVNAQESGGESSPQIWTVSYPGGDVSRVTNDLSSYSGLSVSADGRSFVSVRAELRSRIWAIPEGETDRAAEITAGAGTDDGVPGLAWTPDGRIVYAATTSGNSDIWIMNADGSNRVQVTNAPGEDVQPLVTPDGAAVVFGSEREGARTLWRMNIDGSVQQRLGAGPVGYRPVLSFDGQWVYYSDPQRQNFRIPVAGGTPEPLLAELTAAGRPLPPAFHEPVPSPDGRSVAGHYQDTEQRGERMVVLSLDPDASERRFPNVPPNARWAPDGRSLIFNDGVNLWRQPIAGGNPVQITRFTGDETFSFAVSADQHRWALVRGQVDSDVVLVSERQ